MSETVTICFTVVAVLAIALGSSLTYCASLDEKYYTTITRCVDAGGTWIPKGGGSHDGTCVATQKDR